MFIQDLGKLLIGSRQTVGDKMKPCGKSVLILKVQKITLSTMTSIEQ